MRRDNRQKRLRIMFGEADKNQASSEISPNRPTVDIINCQALGSLAVLEAIDQLLIENQSFLKDD